MQNPIPQLIIFDVSQEDIEQSRNAGWIRPRNETCPIALALKRTLDCSYVNITLHIAFIDGCVYDLCTDATDFVDIMDSEPHKAKPGTFTLELA